MAPYGSLYGDDAEDALITSKTGAKPTPDPPKKGTTATPMDSTPLVVGGEYPSEVDWIEVGKPFANQGVMANRLRGVMNSLGSDNFQEQTDAIKGDIKLSGPQLDNAGDITYCMFLAATCVFSLVKKNNPKIGIKIIAGNNQFFKNFQNSDGELLDNNHTKGKAINFEIVGIDNNKAFEELKPKDQNKINAVEEVLQAVTAGNKYFQYVNEYKKGTRDGDPRNNFLMSMSGPCCPAPEEGNIYIELNSNGDVIRQYADWWNEFCNDNDKKTNLNNPNPSQREGKYDGYVEGIDEKETAIGLAIMNIVEIVDLYDIAEAYRDEYVIDAEEVKDFLDNCVPKLKIKYPPTLKISIPKINITLKFPTRPIRQRGRLRDKAEGYNKREEKYYVGRTKPRYLKNGNIFSGKKQSRRQSGGPAKTSGYFGSKSF
jgi:hypothetical protein